MPLCIIDARVVLSLPPHNHHLELIIPPFVRDHTQKIKNTPRAQTSVVIVFFHSSTPARLQQLWPETILHAIHYTD